MKKDEIYEVTIIDEDLKGNGIAKINGFVVFINGALINTKIKIKIIEVKKRFAYGQIIDQINNLCPYFYQCGGCNYLHLSDKRESEQKEEQIKIMFPNIKINTIVSLDKYNYRNKVLFHVKNNKIGFYNDHSHDLVEIDKCLLVNNNINEVLGELKKLDLSKITEVLIKSTYTTDEIMLILYGNINNKEIDKLKNIKIKSIYVNDILVKGKTNLIEIIDNYKFLIGPTTFFQVNSLCMTKMYNKIKEYSGFGSSLLDLYCGTGTIGIYLHQNFKSITGVEIVKESIDCALINKELNKIDNINFINNDASYIKNKVFSCVVVDPPRSGLSKKVLNNLLEMKSDKIIYVSCNPNTLKKDLERLQECYNIKEITPFNMFFRTEHVECVCLLEKRKI